MEVRTSLIPHPHNMHAWTDGWMNGWWRVLPIPLCSATGDKKERRQWKPVRGTTSEPINVYKAKKPIGFFSKVQSRSEKNQNWYQLLLVKYNFIFDVMFWVTQPCWVQTTRGFVQIWPTAGLQIRLFWAQQIAECMKPTEWDRKLKVISVNQR